MSNQNATLILYLLNNDSSFTMITTIIMNLYTAMHLVTVVLYTVTVVKIPKDEL